MSVTDNLYQLYSEAKKRENCLDYIDELCDQIELFGTETNSLTKDHILNRLAAIVDKIKRTMQK